jgi:alkylation response protein AidB-like acyl-CoA dehydrogenase
MCVRGGAGRVRACRALHVSDRVMGERPLSDLQGLQWKLADMAVGVDTVQAQRNFIGLRVAAGGRTGSPGRRRSLQLR